MLKGVNINELYKEAAKILTEAKNRHVCPDDLDFYAWPQTFSSTAGPHGGIGGSGLTKFTVFAFVEFGVGCCILWCDGIWEIKKVPFKVGMEF